MSIYEIDAKVKELRELRNMEAEVLSRWLLTRILASAMCVKS